MKKSNTNIILLGLAGIAAFLGFQLSKSKKQLGSLESQVDDLSQENQANDQIITQGLVPVFQELSYSLSNSLVGTLSFKYKGGQKVVLSSEDFENGFQYTDVISVDGTALMIRRSSKHNYIISEGNQSLTWRALFPRDPYTINIT